MPEEDRELSQPGAGELDAPEGASPSDLRLTQAVDDGEPDADAEGVLASAGPAEDPVPPCDVCGRDACVGNIKAFVRGGMPGLRRLHKVLPNIFKTFPVEDARGVLIQCGLKPIWPDGAEYPTFAFNPLKGCPLTPENKRRKKSSDELTKDYEAARSDWSS
jgi:hypothetical protein